jgi:hypothetical protein
MFVLFFSVRLFCSPHPYVHFHTTNPFQLSGRWYVIATLFDNIASAHCNVVVFNNTIVTMTITCHAQAYVLIAYILTLFHHQTRRVI